MKRADRIAQLNPDDPNLTAAQRRVVWLTIHNPLITDAEWVRLLALRDKPDPGLMSRIRSGKRDLTVEQATMVEQFCARHHGKMVRVKLPKSTQVKSVRFVGKPMLGTRIDKDWSNRQRAGLVDVQPLQKALDGLRRATNLVRLTLKALVEKHPDIDVMTQVPCDPDNANLDPMPRRAFESKGGKVWQVADHASIQIVNAPVALEVEGRLVLLDIWPNELVYSPQSLSADDRTSVEAVKKLTQRVRARQADQAAKGKPELSKKSDSSSHVTDAS